jgi:hypothetical protein
MIFDYLKDIYNKLNEYLFGKDEEEIPEPIDPLMIINSDENIKPDDSNQGSSYGKYIIYGLIIIAVGALTIIYQEEIQTAAISTWEWMNSFRSGRGDQGGNPGGNNPRNNNNNNIDRFDTEIDLIDRIVYGGPNQESITERSGSPSSVNSNETIKPITSSSSETISSTSSEIDKNIESKLSSSSSDKLFYEKISSIDYWSDNWKNWIHKDIKEQILFIENLIYSDNKAIENNKINEITDKFIDIVKDYNAQIELFNKGKFTSDNSLDNFEKISWNLRKWISDTNFLINGIKIDE